MGTYGLRSLSFMVVALALSCFTASAGEKAREVVLTDAGQKLAAEYTSQLESLRGEIRAAIPVFDEKAKADFEKAREAVKNASKFASTKQKALSEIQSATGLLGHRKGWVSKAEKNIAAAEAKIKKATSDTDRKAAQDELAKAQADKAEGLKELKKSEEAVAKAKLNQAQVTQENQAAQEALAQARANEISAAGVLLAQAESFLSSDKWDAKLTRCALLAEATPKGLAEFAQQGKEHEMLVEGLLANNTLMKEMLEAGGAKAGNYGQAMKIFADIQKASPQAAKDGILRRLALGTSLEHAVPVIERNKEASVSVPAYVDPVKRYLHYEKAFQNGELDPAFKNMTVWEYRMITDCGTPDSILEWGRNMLRNYRPDHVINPDYGWRYSGIVRSDVAYRSSSLYKDSDSLGFFQNIIKNGGICGRRAFFGRFIVQSFGLPVWGVTQHKHAALGRWTPKGWVVNLGANWQFSWFEGRSGPDFILETQARKLSAEYPKVLRAEWASSVLGEPKYDSMKEGSGGLWGTLAIFKKKALVAEAKPAELAALGQELGEANESDDAKSQAVVNTAISDSDKKVDVAANGVITIPAAACKGGQPMKSFLGGHQLFFGKGTLSCEVEAPSAGRYALTARVVTVHDPLQLQLNANGAKDAAVMNIPYTCGQWQKTDPVEVTLVQGKNVLSFSNPTQSFSLKDFTLTPVK